MMDPSGTTSPLLMTIRVTKAPGGGAIWRMTCRDGQEVIMAGGDGKGFDIAGWRKKMAKGMASACQCYLESAGGTAFQRTREFAVRMLSVGRQFLYEACPRRLDNGRSGEPVSFAEILKPQGHWNTTKSPGIIELICSRDHLLPLESLPLFGQAIMPGQVNGMELTDIAELWPAFRYQVRRRLPNAPATVPTLGSRSPSIRIAHFWHHELEGARGEREFFHQEPRLSLLGSWPLPGEVTEALRQRLVSRFEGCCHEGGEVNEMTHLSCHAGDGAFDLQCANGVKHSFKVAELVESGPGARSEWPGVFLNACGANFMPSQGGSLVYSLARRGNPLVIGPEAIIPDSEAAFLAGRFYYWFLRGYSAGHALHAAKMDLLTERSSLLGMFYTIYGNPDLYLHPRHLHKHVN